MGGDLAGLRARLDHLQGLGVGGLLLTPIFLAGQYHRYDTWDYHQVDPRLGTNQDLAALGRTLHERGLRLVLDGVFNHVGAGHRWFNRHGVFDAPGAWQDRHAPTADHFRFRRHPDRYECWLGVEELVKLDYRSQRLREAIYAGADSVVRRWLRPPYDADGWRLDVANMLGRCGEVQLNAEVLRELRAAVKATRPDAYLLGENFFDATAQLQGDQLDAAQDYQGFHVPVVRWLTGAEPLPPRGLRARPPLAPAAAGAEQLAASLLAVRARVPFAIAQAQLHQLSSHDTPRILTVLADHPGRLRVAVALLLLWPGVPCLYYGDEVGLRGGRDPENRGGMVWDPDRWDHDLLAWHRALIALRRDDPVLGEGGVTVLHARGDVLVFARILGPDARLVALNRADRARRVTVDASPLGWRTGEVVDRLTDGGATAADGRLVLRLPPHGVRLLAGGGRP
jgi:alpha-glucosidase